MACGVHVTNVFNTSSAPRIYSYNVVTKHFIIQAMRVKDIFQILCFGRWFLEFRFYVTDVATLYGKEVNECNGGVQIFHKSGFHL
jgi:hypothetical protein